MERKSHKAYIVQAVVGKPIQTSNMIVPGKRIFLAIDSGYFQWVTNSKEAYAFTLEGDARIAATTCPGPWYLMPNPSSIEVVSGMFYPALDSEFVQD
jgi:hypothetical protein